MLRALLPCLLIALLSACGGGSGPDSGPDIEPVVIGGRVSNEYLLQAHRHPQNVALVTRIFMPDGGNPLAGDTSWPVAFAYHGSGGVVREPAVAGNTCLVELESKVEEITDFLLSQGVAVVWVDSFYSRDPRFCEDNDPAFRAWAPAYMDGQLQQVISRVYDTAVAETELCQLKRFDCTRLMRIGTSEGGTAAMLPSHRFIDHSLAQLFDADHPQNRLEQLPLLSYAALPAGRPQPRFVMAIAPGCGFHGALPFASDENVEDLYYPAHPVYLELGGDDSTSSECSTSIGQGRRQLQAEAVQTLESIAEADYRYHIQLYAGEGHPLWENRQADIKPRLASLIATHLAP